MSTHQIVGVVHPGAMGSSLMRTAGGQVLWASENRSPATRARAEASGATEVATLAELTARADIVVSVCPPGSAVELAVEVADSGFDGLYCDANAVSPATSHEIAQRFERFVDGGIIGPPVQSSGSTRLYLSGADAEAVAAVWEGTALGVHVIGDQPGQASALKMAYAGWTKASSALLLAIRAMARAEGVEDALVAEWDISRQGLAARSEWTAALTGPKAWRFVGEMQQIADSMRAAGLSGLFHDGAGDTYQRMAPLKGRENPTLDEVLELLGSPDRRRPE